jgi:predicted nucleotide-binding protein
LAKLDPLRALPKIDEYLAEVNRLLELDYKTGSQEKELINKKIQSFITIAFDDGKDKLKDYNGDVNFIFAVVGYNKTDEEEQADYDSRLQSMKKFLLAYREELQLLSGPEKEQKLPEASALLQDSPRIKKLNQLIGRLQQLRKLHWRDSATSVWIDEVLRFFKREFGENSDYYKDFYRATHGGVVVSSRTTEAEFQQRHSERLEKYEKHLSSFLAELQEEENQQELATAKMSYHPKKVFIVHGHDSEAKLELEKMLLGLGLEPVILSDRPNMGRTIIEKFENNTTDVGYAFVLLTPDDVGGKSSSDVQPRARQNVILELGYFMGKLGRGRVCCLYKQNVELPSDMLGVVYYKFNESVDEVYRKVITELRSVGYDVKP